MQAFTIEQLTNSKQKIALCQMHGVAPLLSLALFRHFYPETKITHPLIELDYLVLYALDAATEPRSLSRLFLTAFKHMKRDLCGGEHYATEVQYARVENTDSSYKARFKHGGERFVFHLLQRDADKWSMTLCYADDD